MAICVCSLMRKHVGLVMSKRQHIYMHIYVIAYARQGFTTFVHCYMIVHGHMVIPSRVISQCVMSYA